MKKLKVNKPWIPHREDLYRMYDDILNREELTNNSKYVREFEEAISKKTGVPFVYTTSSGTLALHIALRALNLEPGDIITTPFSFVATTSSILWEGFKPVFVDVEPQTLCIDANQIEEKINSRTRAILAVHVFGNLCDIEKIEQLGKKYNIPVLFDAAHAFGVNYHGRSVFEYGTISTVSMHASKIVSSIEGGAVFCNDQHLAERLFMIRYFGKNRMNKEEIIGTNAKMSEFNAAFGLLSLRHLNAELERRMQISNRYNEAFLKMSFLDLLDPRYNENRNYAYYPVLLKEESDVLNFIERGKKADIIIRRYWHPSLNTLDFVDVDPSDCPVSVLSANRIVCLPIYSDMTDEDVERVISLFEN